jgi:hypothetical protein
MGESEEQHLKYNDWRIERATLLRPWTKTSSEGVSDAASMQGMPGSKS